jgi:hypothetical protein
VIDTLVVVAARRCWEAAHRERDKCALPPRPAPPPRRRRPIALGTFVYAIRLALRDSTAVTVRSRYTDPFFARGKRHELADDGPVGWHPEFQAKA